jgi:hypothetical protein
MINVLYPYAIVIVLLMLLGTSLVLNFLPRWTRPDLFFGVTVMPGFRDTPQARPALRGYRAVVWGTALALAVIALALRVRVAMPLLPLAFIAGSWFGMALGHRRALEYAVKPARAIEVDLSAPPERMPGGGVPAGLPIVWLLGLGLWAWLYPDRAPAAFGDPNGFLALIVLRLWICLMLALLGWAMLHWSRRIATAGPAAQSERRFRRRMAVVVIATEYLQALPATLALLHTSPLIKLVSSLSLAFAILALAFSLIRFGQGGSRLSSVVQDPPLGDRLADENWKWGIFYVNRADPALMTEKRIGIGYTLNFANPWSWLLLAGLLVVPLLILAILLGRMAH